MEKSPYDKLKIAHKLAEMTNTCTLPEVKALVKEAQASLGPGTADMLVLFAWLGKRLMEARKRIQELEKEVK